MSEARPKLGDRAGLRIELTRACVSTYRQSVAAETMGHARRDLSDEDAAGELDAVLRASYVTFSAGDTMRTRARVTRLEVDCEAELLRVTPDHVRCIFARARRLDTRPKPSRRLIDTHQVRAPDGHRLGYVRLLPSGRLVYREVAGSSGEAPPPWGHLPANFGSLVREPKNGHLREWLASRDIIIGED